MVVFVFFLVSFTSTRGIIKLPDGPAADMSAAGSREKVRDRMNQAEQRDRDFEALQERLSRLSQASLRVNESQLSGVS